METKIENYNKHDVKEGDVYVWNNSEGDVLAEIVNDKDYGLEIKPIKYSYWKRVYETIENDYLTDFNAKLVYRKGRGE